MCDIEYYPIIDNNKNVILIDDVEYTHAQISILLTKLLNGDSTLFPRIKDRNKLISELRSSLLKMEF